MSPYLCLLFKNLVVRSNVRCMERSKSLAKQEIWSIQIGYGDIYYPYDGIGQLKYGSGVQNQLPFSFETCNRAMPMSMIMVPSQIKVYMEVEYSSQSIH